MKKRILSVLAACLVLSLTACGLKLPETEKTQEAATSSTEENDEAKEQARIREEFGIRLDSLLQTCSRFDGSRESGLTALSECADLLIWTGDNLRESLDSEEVREQIRQALERLDEADLTAFSEKWEGIRDGAGQLMEQAQGLGALLDLTGVPEKVRDLAGSDVMKDRFGQLCEAVNTALEEVKKP